MVTFRNNNNNREITLEEIIRSFKSNGDTSKFGSIFRIMKILKEKPQEEIIITAKLIEKYNDLAREALSNGDKILSENYLQHADHFTRM